jgi:hypothetical protein
MEITNWIQEAGMRSFTVGDLKKLKRGERLKFLCMGDRLFDYACDPTTNLENKAVPAQYFFRQNWAEYKHQSESYGDMEHYWMLDESYDGDIDFEFDIEYTENNWCTLQRGKMPVRISPFQESKLGPFIGMTWRDFPDATRLGCEGTPLVLWTVLLDLPNVFWTDDKIETD